jgi:hypothetical protein
MARVGKAATGKKRTGPLLHHPPKSFLDDSFGDFHRSSYHTKRQLPAGYVMIAPFHYAEIGRKESLSRCPTV